MPIPRSTNARLFYRAAKERFEDAELLLSLNRTTGAVLCSIEFDDPSPPLPMPDFSDEGLDQWENGHATHYASPNGKAVLVPLQAQEVDAVKELASAQGLSDGDLLRSWVLEKLKLATATV